MRRRVRNRVRTLPLEIASGVLALALTSGAVAVIRLRLRQPVTYSLGPLLTMTGIFFVAIVIGEVFRGRQPGTRHTAPMATAAALALAMTVECPHGVPAG